MVLTRSKVLFDVGRAVCLLLLAGAINRALTQQPAVVALPFSRGEELIYKAEFTRGLLRGVDVAEFHFRADMENPVSNYGNNGNPFVGHLISDVTSQGFFTKLVGFHFHQRVDSTVEPKPFTVLRTSKLEEAGKRVRVSEAIFDHETKKVTWSEHDPNQSQAPRTSVTDFMEPIQDVLTAIYFLRTQRLQVGRSFEVPLSDAGRVYRLSVAVVERTKIKTAIGHVNVLRIEPALFGENGMVRSQRGTLSIWITEDSRHLPVKAQLKINLGTFDIKLKRISYHETSRAR